MLDAVDDKQAVQEIATELDRSTATQNEQSADDNSLRVSSDTQQASLAHLTHPVPLAAVVRQALDAARASCQARNQRFFTPNLLLALLELPANRVGSCFDAIRPCLATWLRDRLRRHLATADVGPFVPFEWEERRDVVWTQNLVGQTGTRAITDLHLSAAALDTKSNTKRQLAKRLGSDFDRLRKIAICSLGSVRRTSSKALI